MDETLKKLQNVAAEQQALGDAAFKIDDFAAAAVHFKHAAVATEASNAFEDATTETEVFSTRTPIVEIAGKDAEKRHAALLKIFVRLRDDGLKEALVQAISHLPASMLVDEPRIDAITENAVKTYHLITQKEKGEDEIHDDQMHMNEFIDLVSCVEVQVVGGDLKQVELVYLDATMPSTMAALLLSQPKRIAWRMMRILAVFAIMLMYIMFGGAMFQLLEQKNDIQISQEYLAEWEQLSATIDASISEESERKFTLDKGPAANAAFNASNATALNETDRARRNRAAAEDMFDHAWFDAVSDELWSTQQHRRGLDGATKMPPFDNIATSDSQAGDDAEDGGVDEVADSTEAAGWQSAQRLARSGTVSTTDTSARWTEKSQHWLTRGCNSVLNAAETAKWGNDDEAAGKVACCLDEHHKHDWLEGCRVKTIGNMCFGGDPLDKNEAGPDRTYAEAVGICKAEGRRLCSKAEMEAQQTQGKGCCGTGCNGGWLLHWTSDQRPVAWPLPPPPEPPAHWLQPGCLKSEAFIKSNIHRSMWGVDHEALGRVECCSDGACSRKGNGVCYGLVNDTFVLSTYTEAVAMCEATGNRLCTKEETAEVQGPCCNKGCSMDSPLAWTSEGKKVTKEINTGKHYLEDGCPLSGQDPAPMLGNDGEKLGEVQCCSMYGGDCRRQNSDKECYATWERNTVSSATFAEADAICAADGRVLCSRAELASESCCNKGCGHDHALTWTRDTVLTTTTTTTRTYTTITTFANQAVADALDTDDAYTGDDPNQISCWEYSNVDVTVSYKEEAGRVSTGDFGIDKCFFQYYTEKSLNASDKIIGILNGQLETLKAEVDGLRGTLEQTDNARCAQPTSATASDSNWNFWGSCFFSMTLATTIGYGNFVPVTSAGQWFAILYGVFGILLYMPLLAILSSSMWLPIMDSLVLNTNFRNWHPESAAFKLWYSFTTTVLVVGYLVLVSALHMHNTNTVNEDADWQYGEAIYYSVMTFTTIGLGDRVVENPNDHLQMFGTVFSSIFGLSLLCSYLGQYGQWATAAAATSPVDISHSMAYGGDGPFVDDDTFPTRRASLQQALDKDSTDHHDKSKNIESRLAAVFVLGTAAIKERRASQSNGSKMVSIEIDNAASNDGEYITVAEAGEQTQAEGKEESNEDFEETAFGFGNN